MMLFRLSAPAVVLLLALACSPGGGTVPEPAPQGGDPSEQADGQEGSNGEDGAEATLAADAEVNGTCRTQPRQGNDGAELVADVEVVNTGDLGVKVRIAARWPQPNGQGIIHWKRVNVEQGGTRELTLRLAVGDAEAEAVRDAVKLDRICSVKHRVIGAYGN